MKNEQGEIMIEGTFVMFFSTMIVFLFMSMLVAIYHNGNISVAANEAAADIAMTYGPSYKDPFMNYTELSYFEKHELYRHSLFRDSYDVGMLDKAKWYACYRLQNVEFSPAESGYELVDVKFETNDFGKRQVYVTLERRYYHLTEYPFVLFGMKKGYTAKATGVAECYDMIDYINGIDLGGEMAAEWENNTIIGGFIKKGVSIWDNMKGIMEKFANSTK